jgi:hypothetical protein
MEEWQRLQKPVISYYYTVKQQKSEEGKEERNNCQSK